MPASAAAKASISVCLPYSADRGGGKETRLRHRPVQTQLLGETALGTVVSDLLATDRRAGAKSLLRPIVGDLL